MGAESFSQRHLFLAGSCLAIPGLEVVVHDDACHLCSYALRRTEQSDMEGRLANLRYITDPFHARGHVRSWCLENCGPRRCAACGCHRECVRAPIPGFTALPRKYERHGQRSCALFLDRDGGISKCGLAASSAACNMRVLEETREGLREAQSPEWFRLNSIAEYPPPRHVLRGAETHTHTHSRRRLLGGASRWGHSGRGCCWGRQRHWGRQDHGARPGSRLSRSSG